MHSITTGELTISKSNYIEFWCTSENGVMLYHHSINKNTSKLNYDLISSFLSAILLLLKMNTTENIEIINFKNSRFFIHHSQSIYFFLRTKLNNDKNKDQQLLFKIKDAFIHQFNPILPNWHGRVDEFDQFDATIRKIIKKENNIAYSVLSHLNIYNTNI